MEAHEILGVPRIGAPPVETRWLGWVAASAAVHLVLVWALPRAQESTAWAPPLELGAVETKPPTPMAGEWASAPTRPEHGEMGQPSMRTHEAIRAAKTASVLAADLPTLVSTRSFAALTGTSDLAAGLDVLDDTDLPDPMNVEGYYGTSGFFGTAETGTGWGTIGTGRYGTLEPGSGVYNNACCGGTPPAHHVDIPVPRVTPTIVDCGSCEKADLHRFMVHCGGYLQSCMLRSKTPFTGIVMLHFVVLPSGAVSAVWTSSADPLVTACVNEHFAQEKAKRPASPYQATIKLRFSLR